MGCQKIKSRWGHNIWKIAVALVLIYGLVFAGGMQVFNLPLAVQLADAAEYVRQRIEPGDVVVTMGAGDVWKVADELVQRAG